MPDDDRVAATLAGAKRIADGLQFACRLPDKIPDFTACGGPAAEAYWNYFTPARISSLLAAVEAVLKLADDAEEVRDYSGYETHGRRVGWRLDPAKLREAVTAELAGEAGDG